MRLSLFLNKDIESNIALNCLLPTLSKYDFNIYLTEKVGNESPIEPLRQLAFLEREFPNQYLFPELEMNPGRGFLSFDQIKNKYGVSVTVITSLQASLKDISAFNPDLFISIRFGKIFKGEVLSIPPLGIINLHSAILPNYKGVMGTFRALLNGETKIGTTTHYITDSGIDTGKIISINERPVTPGKSVLWHIVNLYPQAIATLQDIIDKIAQSQKIDATPQPLGGQYYSFPTMEDFDQLNNKGWLLYDWNEYSDLLHYFYKVDKDWVVRILNELGNKPQSA